MSEPTPESPTGTANPTPADVPTTETQGDPADLGDSGKKALEAERKRATKAERDLKAMQTRLDEFEAAKLSDLERAQKQAADAATEAEKARAEVLRYRIAAKHGVTDEDAELFLTGSDEDTLTRQAQRLAARVEESQRTGNIAPSVGSKTNLSGGTDDTREFVRDLFGRANSE